MGRRLFLSATVLGLIATRFAFADERGTGSIAVSRPRHTTTPRAMVGTMNALLVGDILSADSRQRLLQWLKDSATGLARLRAGLPPDWVAGDKTGTGINGAANDVAIAWPPGRAPILIASYLSDSDAVPDALNGAHVAIAAAVARQFA